MNDGKVDGRMREPTRTRWLPSWGLLAAGAVATLLASATITHVLMAPTGSRSNRAGDPGSLPRGAPVQEMVLVRADDRRLVGEGPDGSFVTLELEGDRGRRVAAAAHVYMHAAAAQVVRVAYRTEGERSIAIAIVEGPEDFPGVSRAAPLEMSDRQFDAIDLGMRRNDVLQLAGPPHVPGIDERWRGEPADCFSWRADDRPGSYRVCFDQSSNPRVVGREHED